MTDSQNIITVTLNPTIDRVIEVDNLAIGEHLVGRTVLRTPGGKGVNVSRVLAAMGVSSTGSGFLGEDNRAEFDPLFADGIVKDAFVTSPGRTRENITLVDPASNREMHIRDRGLEIDGGHLEAMRKKLRGLCKSGDVVVFAGSLPPGVEPEQFSELIDLCIAADARVAVDTSAEAIRVVAGKKLWVLKPNVRELGELVGRKLLTRDEQLAAAAETAQHVEFVLLSCGSEGAYLLGKNLNIHASVKLPPSTVRNTVGCGDVLLGGFIGGFGKGQTHDQALRQAVACAAASAAHPATAMFDAELCEKLETKVELTEL